MADRIGDWIQTATGRQFYPLDPRPEDVCIEDIAHALSNVCRFAGHSAWHYSVAQHCVLASEYAPPEYAIAALLHDAAEAYMGDIARPWKRFLYVKFDIDHGGGITENVVQKFKDAESQLLDVILTELDTETPYDEAVWKAVAEIDMRMLATEARDLMSPLAGDGWGNTFQKAPCEARYAFNPYPAKIGKWTPEMAKIHFLSRYRELKSQPLPAPHPLREAGER